MAGEASEAQTAAFLIALRTKGETVQELVGLARTMRDLAVRVEVDRDDMLDTAGTGGGRPTFNVSTTAAFVAAGAGCIVAKHGKRRATGRSGSGGRRGGGGGLHRGEARQPQRDWAERLGGRARGPGRAHRPGAGGGGGVHRGRRL